MSLLTNKLGIMYVSIDCGAAEKKTMDKWLVSQRVAQSTSVITELVHAYDGIVSKSSPAAMLCTFHDANATVTAAREILSSQLDGSKSSTITSAPLDIRIALNYGKMMVAAGNISGDELNITVQMHTKVKAGQILATTALVDSISDELRVLTSTHGTIRLADSPIDIEVYDIYIEEGELDGNKPPPSTKTVPAQTPKTPSKKVKREKVEKSLQLHYKDERFVMDASQSELTLGRSKENIVVVDSRFASRKHMRIVFSKNRFVLYNMGTNGTYIRCSSNEERTINYDTEKSIKCMDKMLLQEDGELSLGCEFDDAEDIISFFIS